MIEIICSGFGGQGNLVAGMILADAAMEEGKEVSWYPTYGFEMRGGSATCDVKISDEEIASPYCKEADIVYALCEPAVESLEGKLKPGGVLLVNSDLVSDDRTYRDDITVVKIPANEIANAMENVRGVNIVMLGALAEASKDYDVETLGKAVDHYFAKKGKVNPKNLMCFNAGAVAAKEQL